MIMRTAASLAAIAAVGVGFSAVAQAEVKVKLEPVATNLTAPLAMVQPKGDDRKFIMEQIGLIKIMDADGNILPEPFLNIRSRLVDLGSDFDEQGLLGLTFHPDFAENGHFYIAFSSPLRGGDTDLAKKLWWAHTNNVVEMRVSADNPNAADPTYIRYITSIDWPQFNHNGHWIDFGPDGYLYISTGDGGYANDWGIGHNVALGNGQDNTTLLGKMLRIDVDGGEPYGIPADNPFAGSMDAMPEIFATGLRNPWRCSFDMGGDNELFCGDVQQNSFEEISIVAKGANLGWRAMEATHCFDYQEPNSHPASCETAGLTMPIMEYKNCTAIPGDCMGISVTGGYVYRGEQADWDGKYIFGDWSKSFSSMDGQLFFGSKAADGTWSMEKATVEGMDTLPYILAFAQDQAGEVYALTSVTTGPVGGLDTIYKIVPAN